MFLVFQFQKPTIYMLQTDFHAFHEIKFVPDLERSSSWKRAFKTEDSFHFNAFYIVSPMTSHIIGLQQIDSVF